MIYKVSLNCIERKGRNLQKDSMMHNLNDKKLKKRYVTRGTLAFSAVIITILLIILWIFFVDRSPSPTENTPSNQQTIGKH
jgi:cytoskeletal protein RodZ